MPTSNACLRHKEDAENPGRCCFCNEKLDEQGRDPMQAALHEAADALDKTTFLTNEQLLEEARQRVADSHAGAVKRGKQALEKLREAQ